MIQCSCSTNNEVQLSSNCMPIDFDRTKKMVLKLGFGYQKIDYYMNGCMLYYKQYPCERQCLSCEAVRFISKRLSHDKYRRYMIRNYGTYLSLPCCKRYTCHCLW